MDKLERVRMEAERLLVLARRAREQAQLEARLARLQRGAERLAQAMGVAPLVPPLPEPQLPPEE